MIYQTIQGEEVPALGFGTYRITRSACRKAVEDALSIGYRHIDTAQSYGNEAQVGEALSAASIDRDDIFLTTKLWVDQLAPRDVRRATEQSLKKLRTDYVDLLLIHWPNEDVPLHETLDAFRKLQEEGKTRHIGVSNFTPSLLEEAMKHAPIFCIQVEYHPFLSQHQLLQMARSNDLLLTAYSPIARGKVMDSELLQTIAEAHRKTPVQVTLRWLVQQKNVAAIPKASTAAHRESNFDIFDFELSREEMKHIFDLARGERIVNPPQLAPAWGT